MRLPAIATSLALLPFLVLASTVSAQKTWIVDANGGGHFKTHQAAVDAASPGDSIYFKAGTYYPMVASKPLHFSGDPGAWLRQVQLRDLPAGSRSTLRALGVVGLVLNRNRGGVHCESLILSGNSQYGIIAVRDCALTTFLNCSFSSYQSGAPLTVANSIVTLTGCSITGGSAGGYFPRYNRSVPALSVTSTDLRISGCKFKGGSGFSYVYSSNVIYLNASPAISMSGGSLIIDDAGGTALTAGAPAHPKVPSPAVVASGTRVTIDPAVTLKSVNTTQHVAGTTPTMQSLPGLIAQGAMPGAQIGTARYGTPGSISILVLGLPAVPRATPNGELWLDTKSLLAINPVVMPTLGIHPLGIPVPRVGVPSGLAVTFQGIELIKSKLSLSLPTTVMVY
jgi:hypothetical protein